MRYLNPYAALFLALGLIFMITSLRAQGCYELVWSDEFNYTGLPDPAKWTHEVGGGGYGNNELQYYTENRLENSRVEDGNLIIEARKEFGNLRDHQAIRNLMVLGDLRADKGEIARAISTRRESRIDIGYPARAYL